MRDMVGGDTAALATILDTNLTSTTTWPRVLEIVDSFDAWRPDSLKLVGWNIVTLSGDHLANLTYQVHTTRGWLLLGLDMKGTPAKPLIRGFHWEQVPDRLERLNQFSLRGKPFGAYLVVLLAGVMAAISIGTALYLPFTALPRKWGWAALALLGCTRFDLNWTTGATSFLAFMLTLFSAGFQRGGPYAPWVISVSFPFGAMLAWRRLHAWRQGVAKEGTA